MNYIYSLLILLISLPLTQEVLDGYTIFTPQVGNPNGGAETKLVSNN